MPWRSAILIAVLAACFWATPASAGIQRVVDSQGVIRISNVAPAKEGLSQQTGPAKAPGQKEPAHLPETAPAAAELQPAPGPQAVAAPVPEKSPAAIATSQDQSQSLKPVPEKPQTASPPETGENSRPFLLQKVAYDSPDGGVAPRPAASTAPAANESASKTAGGIHRFRDSQGVWHITNVAPGAAVGGDVALPAKNGHFPGHGQPNPAADWETGSALQKVAWNPDNPGVSPFPDPKRVARNATPGPANAIRHYRDSQGIIHIDNLGAGGQAPLIPAVMPGRAKTGEEYAPPPLIRPPPLIEAGLPAALKLVAWVGGDGFSPAVPPDFFPSWNREFITPGGIHGYRDSRGVWHIERLGDPGPREAPAAPQPDPGGQELVQAGLHLSPRPPGIILPAGPSGPGSPVSGIMALRDHRGRLTITNLAPEVRPGTAMPSSQAMALVEPIIQEAARAYNLPPTLIRAVIKVESNFVTWAVSPKGAMGLMQLMPGTAADLGVREPFNPRENIHGGCRYLRFLLDSFGGSLPLALAAYNAGQQRVVNCGYRVPEIKETQDFLAQVIGWYLAEEKKAQRPWT